MSEPPAKIIKIGDVHRCLVTYMWAAGRPTLKSKIKLDDMDMDGDGHGHGHAQLVRERTANCQNFL